ncbi:Transmembrane protein 273 [Camelus dromedarius]|uniref:Transmembrane protein 273 n=1 Tax=Camelus dromedarius TaxID=9838 RepID=A0A5N4DIU2_CAMDR|nr:Transmembrane protein 273 [Camelus dromedarius]
MLQELKYIKYALIGTALGIAILAGFLALKICMIRKHLFDNDSSDLRSTNMGFNGKEMVVVNPSSTPARHKMYPGQPPSGRLPGPCQLERD